MQSNILYTVTKPRYNVLINLFYVDSVLERFAAVCLKCHHQYTAGDNRMSTDASKYPMISIVDDDPFIRQASDNLVQSIGYRSATFASAEEFLQSSYIHETTCLITDVQMPGLSGLDLQRVLIAGGNRTPIIFITAYFDERIRQRVMEAGAIGYLSKPFNEQNLIELLQSVHHRDDLEPQPKSWILRITPEAHILIST